MDRGNIINDSVLLGSAALIGVPAARAAGNQEKIMIEHEQNGTPHKGRVLAAIQAHLDDIPFKCAGTVAKLINEGYTGYLIRTSNDEKAGGGTPGENILSNAQENLKMAKAAGFADVIDLYYRNHRMDDVSSIELRARLILLLRALKVDTVFTFNPWGSYEENPDHWVTARAVEGACWMAGGYLDYPEHFEAGYMPHSVKERYYFVQRPGQPFNRVVDTSSTIEKKIDAIVECRSQGGGNRGSQLRNRLAREGKRLPFLGGGDRTADREYVRRYLITPYKELGEQYGFEYAEKFYYTSSGSYHVDHNRQGIKSLIEEDIKKHGVKL
jgi:LmbE family N-acetylglucosaminyl deacetylase